MIDPSGPRTDALVARLRALVGLGPGDEVAVFRAPGRINVIGEHTDYNEGLVMPAAIDRSAWVAATLRGDRRVDVSSTAFPGRIEFSLDQLKQRSGHQAHWSDYVRGVAFTIEEAGERLSGASLLIDSEVPTGSGLSSSAALEVAVGRALLELSGLALPPMDLARLCQRAENVYVGTRCGIMDQFASCCGQAGQVLMLDCRSLDSEALPLPAGVQLVVCNTGVKHELAGSEYNVRGAECQAGVRALASRHHGLRSLREVTLDELEAERQAGLDATIYRRCRHVITENARVLDARDALVAGRLDHLARLMADSHASLRDDYQVSCRELDAMVELAVALPGVHGARMTGAGFGGSTVNLVEIEQVPHFMRAVADGYERALGRRPEILACDAGGGAERVR